MSGPRVPPTVGIFDGPGVSMCLNTEWASFIDGIVAQLLSRARWKGTEAEIDGAIDQVETFLAKLGDIGACALTPVGGIMMWPAATAPDGWLKCQGQSLLRASYPDLFAILGTTYGAADGTHFSLPDYRQRSPYGVGTTGLVLGDYAGAATGTLSVNQLPPHHHIQHIGNNVNMRAFVAGGSGTLTATGAATSSSADMVTADTGAGDPYSTLHPIIMTNYIIFTGT
jgi:microcystin-dependent protein